MMVMLIVMVVLKMVAGMVVGVMMVVLVERMLLFWFTLRRIIMSNRLNEAFFASFQRTAGPS